MKYDFPSGNFFCTRMFSVIQAHWPFFQFLEWVKSNLIPVPLHTLCPPLEVFSLFHLA